MDTFELADLQVKRASSGRLYHEFLRVPAMSAGIYELASGGMDPQQPHTEDEIYYVIEGHGQIRVADEDRPVQSGSIVYVPAQIEHYFHTITEDLTILVVFAPAEEGG